MRWSRHDQDHTRIRKVDYASTKASILFFIARLTPFVKEICALLIVAFLWSIDFSLRPYLVKIILDKLSCAHAEMVISLIAWPVLGYLGATLLNNICGRLCDLLMRRVKPQLKKDTTLFLMQRSMRHKHRFFQTYFAGDLAVSIQNVTRAVADLFFILSDRFIQYGMALSIAVIMISRVNIYLGMVLCCWIIVYLVVACLCAPILRRLSVEQSQAQMKVVGNIVDIFANMMTVRLFAGVAHEGENLERWTYTAQQKERARDLFLIQLWLLQGLLFVIVLALCSGLLMIGFKHGIVSIGDFGLILTINISIAECLANIAKEVSKATEQWGLLIQGLNVIALDRDLEIGYPTKQLHASKGEIRFEKVSFSHAKEKPLFNELSVTIKAGQKVGLVGSSGSGKTTFVYLILRLFDVQSGHIYIDGQDIAEVDADSLRRCVSMIPQDPVLFHRTLKENIQYGSFDAPSPAIVEAAKKAHIDDFIDMLPHGYDTIVGERGSRLSGGQRQRIAIARAMLKKDARLLMLDEATSALDSITEQYIQESITDVMRDKTTIVVAHRLSTLLHMDRILVFEGGAIVEDGSHHELTLKNGLYQRLWNTQVGGFLPDEGDHSEEA